MKSYNQYLQKYQYDSANTAKGVIALYEFIADLSLDKSNKAKLDELILTAEMEIEEQAFKGGYMVGAISNK